jgi:hypothetical protein
MKRHVVRGVVVSLRRGIMALALAAVTDLTVR